MSSPLRLAVVLSNLCLAALAYGVGERPASKTIGYGAPHLVVPAEPTNAPSWDLFHDLLKIKPRVVTNVCSEWTLLGDGGQPACTGSSTCLFDTVSGFGYEACALTSSSFYQVTECWNYPKTYTVSPIGQIFCDATAPYCGYYAFVFDNGDVFSNFGCSTSPYSSTATLLPSALASYTPVTTNSVITTGRPTVTSTATPIVVVVTASTTSASNSASTTASPTFFPVSQNSSRKNSHLGAIVGGAVGGIAVIGIIAAVIFCCLYKNRKARRQENDQATAATAIAYQAAHANNYKPPIQPDPNFSELSEGGYGKPQMVQQTPMGAIHTTEKPTSLTQSQEQHQQYYSQSPFAPPPVYNQASVYDQPSSTLPTPSPTFLQTGHFPELAGDRHTQPMSPLSGCSTGNSSPQGGLSPRPQSNVMEMSAVGFQQSFGQFPLPPTGNGHGHASELPARQPHLDMSGAPMSENYHELHE
ncbi:hypothetical protein BP6252_07848 [Coleophoma cylindrospora]|uniref:Mid2 domain-containing protein n=1 Tax=Coleophoma cylindrospora TaxID=1849047 RepID=A0A3D8RB94_9HELO|nr:hypothetical protein BP6252_07848 [Coleophoma cylindrospora]